MAETTSKPIRFRDGDGEEETSPVRDGVFEIRADSDAVPLHHAVLCINCECITNGLSDGCLVCGSHSLFSLARLLDGTELSHKGYYYKKERFVLFDAEITINLATAHASDKTPAAETLNPDAMGVK